MPRPGTLAVVGLLCGLGGLTAKHAFVAGPRNLPSPRVSRSTVPNPAPGQLDAADASGSAGSASAAVLATAVAAVVAKSRPAPSKTRMAARGGSRGGAKGGSAGVADPLQSLQQLISGYFFQSSEWQSGLAAVAGTAMRVIVALLVIHHGTEHTADGSIFPGSNPKAVEGFAKNVVAPYMGWLPILDSVGWTIVRDWTEVVCGFLMVVGLFTRPAALGMCVTMILATYFHIEKTGWQGFPFGHVPAHTYEFELSLANTMVFAFFAVAGAGPISLDYLLDKFVLNKVAGEVAPKEDAPEDVSQAKSAPKVDA